ncbi:MAG: Fur family transcriptional regulator [Candidatus Omnitrophota bacterium]
MKNHPSELQSKINSQGYRITKPRQKIIDALSHSKNCLSVDDIYMAIRAKGDSVGVTTIYRAVDSLAKAGIIRKLSLISGKTSYELIDPELKHHHHLICRSCQRVIDYSDFINEEVLLIKKLEKIVSQTHHFDIEDHMLSFTGLCQLCQKPGSMNKVR